MNIEITKSFILDAIKNEDIGVLRPGQWFAGYAASVIEDCPRCAVGAVLMQALESDPYRNRHINEVARLNTLGVNACPGEDEMDLLDMSSVREQARRLLDLGKPMASLSYIFEGASMILAKLWDEYGSAGDEYSDGLMTEVREVTIALVEDLFPPTVVIDINGFRPAADVKAVG